MKTMHAIIQLVKGCDQMDKNYHWINDSVKIDFALPSMIQELVDELEEMDQKEDWGWLAVSLESCIRGRTGF